MFSKAVLRLPEVKKSCGFNRTDFYGLCKGWRIIFVIFFAPANHRTNPVDQLVANRVQNQPHRRTDRMLTLAEFSQVVILKVTLDLDRGHSAHVDE